MNKEVYEVTIEQTNYKGRCECLCEAWRQKGLLSRSLGPALTYTNPDYFQFLRREWYVAGQLHREDDEPAIQVETCDLTQHHWYKEGVLHRDKRMPALLEKHKLSNIVTLELYYQNGLLNRENGPALITRDALTGVKTSEIWYKSGFPFNPQKSSLGHKPAAIFRDERSGVILQEWYFSANHSHGDKPEKIIYRDEYSGAILTCQPEENGGEFSIHPPDIDNYL